MKVERCALEGVLLLTPGRFEDSRGYFSETYNRGLLAEAGVDVEFVQDNQSLSRPAGTLRGLHFQIPPHAQAKLVRVLRGSVFDVAVDIRAGSPTYGQHASFTLAAAEGSQLYVPAGFAHGFVTLEPDTEIFYKVTDFYAPRHDSGILWNDPDLGVAWPLPAGGPVLSDKDGKLGRFRDLPPHFAYRAG